MKTSDLSWIIQQGKEEIDYYLSDVSSEQFIHDVKELIKKSADKNVIRDTIKKLEELL